MLTPPPSDDARPVLHGNGPFPCQSPLTLFLLHLHHLPLPLIKGGDVLGVFAAHAGIGVGGDGGARVLSHTHTHTRGKVSAGRKQLTPREGFTLWEVLASLCGELGAAGELGGGSGWLLVPAVWTLEVFSRTIGGLLREPEGAFHSGSLFHSKAKIQPEDLKSRLTCRRHKGFPPHSWQEGGRDQ